MQTLPGTVTRLCRRLVLAALVLGAAAHAAEPSDVPLVDGSTVRAERVAFPSLDGAATAPVVLTALWFPAPDAVAPAPAVVLLHGCGGLWNRRAMLGVRYVEYARFLNRLGLHALVVDSLTPRYETELCTQRAGTRRVTQANRRLDALGALAYLATRPDVDRQKLGLLGWSNGGSTVLSATNGKRHDVAQAEVRASFAVAFYPGCEAELSRGYDAAAPLLLLVGLADDWTAPGPCRQLARRAEGETVTFHGYPGAYHAFDDAAPVRLRKDVPNGVRAGQGVHVGGDPAARADARERLRAFLAEHVGRP